MNLLPSSNGTLAYLHTLKFAPRQKVEVSNFAANVAVVLLEILFSDYVETLFFFFLRICPAPFSLFEKELLNVI